MYFVILAEDKADSLPLRLNIRAAHLDYAAAQGCVRLAGPLLSEGADPKPRGSLLIIEVADRTAAEQFAENDPYARAGLFARVEITAWTPVLGDWSPEALA